MTGEVFWVTGLAGAGKSTIAKMLVEHLKSLNKHVVLLDGDELRKALSKTEQYDLNSRRALAKTYSNLCQLLEKQGVTVVCATISLFHEVHRYNRQNILHYTEIFVDADLDTLKQRNQKGLYDKSKDKNRNVVGVSQTYEFPHSPDIVVRNSNDVDLHDVKSYLLERLEK